MCLTNYARCGWSRTLRTEEEEEDEAGTGSVLCGGGCELRLVEDDTAAVRA